MMTPEEQEEMRVIRRNEVGTEPPCPFCQRPRVKRSDYIRCNPCATNWLEGENISRDPRASRKVAMSGIALIRTGTNDGVPTVLSTTEPW